MSVLKLVMIVPVLTSGAEADDGLYGATMFAKGTIGNGGGKDGSLQSRGGIVVAETSKGSVNDDPDSPALETHPEKLVVVPPQMKF